MVRNLLIAASALATIAIGSATTASANGYGNWYGHHNHHNRHNYSYSYKHNYNHDYSYSNHYYKKHFNNYYVQNDCGWQVVKVVRWNDGYKYIDFVRQWTCNTY